ncbi:MAG: 50S ribosomal protein L32 [Candidatus Zambryskibacteria bacterium]|nr:50S ribosomal protein L32 [Candidatus Zambryskibacteria bacterium]
MVVRMRHTKSQRNRTRSHHRLAKPAITMDKATAVPHLRHRASLVTGQYKGRMVIDVQAKLAKKTKKAKQATKEGR